MSDVERDCAVRGCHERYITGLFHWPENGAVIRLCPFHAEALALDHGSGEPAIFTVSREHMVRLLESIVIRRSASTSAPSSDEPESQKP